MANKTLYDELKAGIIAIRDAEKEGSVTNVMVAQALQELANYLSGKRELLQQVVDDPELAASSQAVKKFIESLMEESLSDSTNKIPTSAAVKSALANFKSGPEVEQEVSESTTKVPSSKAVSDAIKGTVNSDIRIALLTGLNIPFKVGGYGGAGTSEAYFNSTMNRVCVEVPVEFIKSFYVKKDCKFGAIITDGDLPTTKYALLTPSLLTKGFDVEAFIKSGNITNFVPKKLIINIADASSSADIRTLSSIDDLIVFNTTIRNPKYDEVIACITKKNIPFELGGISGLGSQDVIKFDSRDTRIRLSLPIDYIQSIKIKEGYKYINIISDSAVSKIYYETTTLNTKEVDIENVLATKKFDFKPERLLIIISKADTNATMTDISNIDDILILTTKEDKQTNNLSIKKFNCSLGTLDTYTGLYYTSIDGLLGKSHTCKFILNRGKFRICKSPANISAIRILYFDDKQHLISYSERIEGNDVYEWITPPSIAKYFRMTVYSYVDEVNIESQWEGEDECFQKLPEDEGYQMMVFNVNLNQNSQPNTVVSQVNTNLLVKSFDNYVLHLPSCYSEEGEGVPLIIYLHGNGSLYSLSSKRLLTRYAPEWDAAGFAQMDVNMLPYIYGTTVTGTCGTGDDVECVSAAYKNAIEHFNIRRDGVYLFGFSRGAVAVLKILSQLDSCGLPVICALSDAGANAVIHPELFRSSQKQSWTQFCKSTGLDIFNPPTWSSGNFIINNSSLTSFLKEHIDIWWEKMSVMLPLMVENNSDYKTPTEIFDLFVESYNNKTDLGKDFIEKFTDKCKFHSPVPLRFDWCVGDTTQNWEETPYGNYGAAGMRGFVNNKFNGNAIFRRWPSCPAGVNGHQHVQNNFYSGEYILPNGASVENPSMAQLEWLLWAMSKDSRF